MWLARQPAAAAADPHRMLDAEPTPNVYRDLVRTAALVVAPDGTVVAANAVVEAVGRHWRDLLVDASDCPVAAVLATGLPRHDVVVAVRGADGVCWWSASARPLVDRDGATLIGVAVTLTPWLDAASWCVAADVAGLEALAATASLRLPAAVAVTASPWAPAR